MLCSSCGSSVNPGKFCTNCGTKAPLAETLSSCSNCNAEVAAGAKFCTQCGTAVTKARVVGGGSATKNQKHCTKCNNVLTAKFCTLCGTAAQEVTTPATTTKTPTTPAVSNSPTNLNNSTGHVGGGHSPSVVKGNKASLTNSAPTRTGMTGGFVSGGGGGVGAATPSGRENLGNGVQARRPPPKGNALGITTAPTNNKGGNNTVPPPPPPVGAKPLPPNPRPPNALLGNCPRCNYQRQTKFCTQCGWSPNEVEERSPPPIIPVSDPPESPGLRKWAQNRSASMSRINPPRAGSMEVDDDGRRLSNAADNPDQTRRSWKKKYDTLKKDQRFTGIHGAGGSESTLNGSTGSPGSSGGTLREAKTRDRAQSYNGLEPRTRVIREIIDTEQDYINDLQIITEIFLKPMRKDEIATPQEITAIFSNVELILGVNEQLLAAFKKSETSRGIAEAFISLAEFLKMYSGFCSNQAQSFEVINKLKEKKDKKFETFLQYCFARPEAQGLDFNAYMIKPVQRICKYPLLLRELIGKSDPTSPEFPLLQEAFNKIESIVNTVNEKKRESEDANKIIDIASRVQLPENMELVSPTRRYIKEGELMHYASNGKLKPGYFFLFNDLFVYTKKKGSSKFSLKCYAPLDVTFLRYVSTYEKPTFELVCQSAPKAWPLVFETEDEKTKFMEELQELIEKTNSHLQNISRRNSAAAPTPTHLTNSLVSANNPGILSAERRHTQLSKPVPPPPDAITFDCTYYDSRRMVLSRSALNYDSFYRKVLETFQVDACTIMWESRFVDSLDELYYMLSDGANYYQLLIYDPYQ